MSETYEWCVVGAGPAGIGAVGKLLDAGVVAKTILWLDPAFKVGDFGQLWSAVPSNTKVALFLEFLHGHRSFEYASKTQKFSLDQEDPEAGCRLESMAQALQWVTVSLLQKVSAKRAFVQKLSQEDGLWLVESSLEEATRLRAKRVILAVGAEAKGLHYSGLETIPLSVALDPDKLRLQLKNSESSIAVFGSSHSAVLVLKNLVDLGARKVVNFYREPLRYALRMEDGIFFDDTGLKGTVAQWAREHLEGNLPQGLKRCYAHSDALQSELPHCQQVIYAVGFERRKLPILDGFPDYSALPGCGIIARGLFGFGLAYPETATNSFGVQEQRVGLYKFMRYLDKVLPLWTSYV